MAGSRGRTPPGTRTRMERMAYATGRATGKAIRTVRRAAGAARILAHRAKARIPYPSGLLSHAWNSRAGRRTLVSALALGMILAGSGKARPQEQERPYHDSAPVDVGTNEGTVDVLLGPPHQFMYSRKKILELARRYDASEVKTNIYEEVRKIVSKTSIGKLGWSYGSNEYEAVLGKELDQAQIQYIDRLLRVEYQKNPQMQDMARELGSAKNQRNLLGTLSGLLVVALIGSAMRRRKLKIPTHMPEHLD